MIGNAWDTWRRPIHDAIEELARPDPDGASQTLFFGETLGGSDGQTRDTAVAWMSRRSTPGMNNGLPVDGQAQFWMYSSRHTGVVNFSFADGSVQSLFKGCDPRVLRSAAGFEDGEVYALSALGN